MDQAQADLSISFSIDFLQAYGQNIAGWQLFGNVTVFLQPNGG